MANANKARANAVVIGGERPLSEAALIKGVRGALPVRQRMRTSPAAVRRAVGSKVAFHHPMWLAKILSRADRPPFRPRVIPNLVFVDAVSGYRGVLEVMPALTERLPAGAATTEPVLNVAEQVEPYVQTVLRKVDRNYMLKKPRHEISELTLAYLPLWKVALGLDGGTEVFVNGNNGEPETFLALLWGTDSWFLDT